MRRGINSFAAGLVVMVGVAACGGSGGYAPLTPAAAPVPHAPTATPATPTPASGQPTLGTPTFPNGGSGTCGTTIVFDLSGQSAVIAITEANYSGPFTATTSDSAVVSAAISASTLTLSAGSAGSATVTIADAHGGSVSCPISVTTTSGSVQ